ncbi:MAG: hypothetical protein A2051_10415 [Desulfovibrionales bacterium GWA2_65_9]|nr:MAG: hypothetical protein A2051_10415 [Desulfovibrionales bacterium GWA2_65_9]
MLAEAVKYAAARLHGQGDPHGHLAQQVAIWARHKRHRAAWEPHLARCKALALASARTCPEDARRTALVLGSGLLLDVPLDELSALFQTVVLADMAFVPEVRAKAARLGNVETLEIDLTGRLDRLPGALAGPLPITLTEVGGPTGLAGLAGLAATLPGLDFAYSANLLSQLPLFALDALPPDMEQERQEELAAELVRQHLEGLKALGCPACLVTDVTERGLRQGAVDYEADLLFGVEPGLAGETWVWDMAPDGEAVRGLDVERVVLGVSNVRAATA